MKVFPGAWGGFMLEECRASGDAPVALQVTVLAF